MCGTKKNIYIYINIYRFVSLQWITIAYNIASLACVLFKKKQYVPVLFKKVNNTDSNCLILTIESVQ